MSENWLPEGTRHGLHIDHHSTGGGFAFDTASRWKTLIHSTEGSDFEAMSSVLCDKSAEPHFLLGKKGNDWHVRQFIGMDEASRSLEHPSGTPATNGARCVQIEVCEYAIHDASKDDWSDELYDALAKLCLMIENRKPVKRRKPRDFSATPHRFGGDEFLTISGIVGHEHAPNQPSGHWDPGDFRGTYLLKRMDHFADDILGKKKPRR